MYNTKENGMIVFNILYNPMTWDSEVKSNDDKILLNMQNFIEDNVKEKDIVDWVEPFVKKVLEETNNESFELCIDGCIESDKRIIEKMLSDNAEVKLRIVNVVRHSDLEWKYKKVDEVINNILSEGSSEYIQRAVSIRKKEIERLKSTVVEIPVIATMSSGKSTILNALIGKSLLPSLNKATTATTCRIIVNNDLAYFRGKVVKGDKVVVEENNINKDFVKNYNQKANEENLDIIIEDPVPYLDTKGFEIHFIDTPG